MRPCFALIPACVALAALTHCAPVHDATPASCPAGQQPSGSTCVCISTQAPPVDGSCDTTPPGDGGTCSVDDCEDDENPCTEPTCLEGADACSNEAVADTTLCDADGSEGMCVSGVCTVPEPEWELGVPFRIGGKGGEIVRPLVTVDAEANAIAVWAEGEVLMACDFESGEGWSEPEVIAEELDPDRVFALDSDAEGNAIVVYARIERGSIDILASRYDSALGFWSAPDVISRPGAVASNPRIAITSDGSALATWWEAPGSILLSRTTTDRLTWDDPTVVSPSDGFEKGGPYISMADSGHGAIIYRGHGATAVSDNVWVNAIMPDGSVVPAVTIDDSASETVYARIAAADDGDLMAVWEQGNDIWYAHFTDGAWAAAGMLEALSAGAFTPQVASGGDGTFFASWAQTRRIRVRRFDRGTGWSDTVTPKTDENANRPFLVASPDAEAWVAWYDVDAIGLWQFTTEIGSGAGETISSKVERNAPPTHRPMLARSQDGALFTVWAGRIDVWAWTDRR